jgi:hypothetical protein
METLMIFAKRFLTTACAVALVFGLAQSSTADPLIITVSMTNSSFTPTSSTTLDTAVFPPASQNSATLSPALIPFYNATFGTTLTNPFAGTGVNWTVQGQVNVPGTPAQGLLQGGTILMHNSTVTTYYAQITVEGGNFTLPGGPGSDVLADTSFSASAVKDGSAWLYAYIDSTLIGSVWYNSPQVGPNAELLYARDNTGNYRLHEVFDITLNGNPTNDPTSNVNISVTTTVTPVSEPWTVVTLMAMVVPCGALWGYYRRPKPVVCAC